jgi:hypothetical protein
MSMLASPSGAFTTPSSKPSRVTGQSAELVFRLLRSLDDARPDRHLQARDQDVLAVLGAEEQSLALLYVEPILSERIDDVRPVSIENGICTVFRVCRQQLAQRFGAAIVLVGADNEAAFSRIQSLLDIREIGEGRSLIGAIKLAERRAEGPCERLAAVVEIALRGSVVEIERVGIRLIGKRRAWRTRITSPPTRKAAASAWSSAGA